MSNNNNTIMNKNDLSVNDIYKFMDLFFDRYMIIYRHLYDSYNKFLEEDIKLYLENGDHTFFEQMTRDKIFKYKFKYENLNFREPTMDNSEPMFPSDARNRNLTYKGRLMAKVTQIQEVTDIATNEVKVNIVGHPEDNIPIADLPVMLRSKFCTLNTHKGYDQKECEMDPGGYFIVNGSEKVIISQDRMCDNKPLVFIKKDSGMKIFTVQVNSKSYKPHGITQIINIRMKKDGIMTIRAPILTEIPVFMLFRALGIESDRDIINYVVYDENDAEMVELVRLSLDNCVNEKKVKVQTKQDAIDFLINKVRIIKKYTESDKKSKLDQRRLHLEDLLKNNLLPHVEGDMKSKAIYFGYMINKLLKCFLKRTKPDDRDSYLNKRIDLPGDLLMELFKQFYRKMLNECHKFFKKRNGSNHEEPLVIINQIKPNIIEQGIKASLLTGAWPRRKGVAQMLQRFTYLQTIAFLRRLDSPGGDASTSKLTSPRNLHQSSVSLLCAVSTPEHAKVGLTKHLAIIASITITHTDMIYVLKSFLKKKLIDVRDVPAQQIRTLTKVFLNGDWVGLTDSPFKLESEMRKSKLDGTFEVTTSIVHDIAEGEIKIYCDGGRIYRPVMRVNENVVNLTKEHIKNISLNKAEKDKKITSWNEFIFKNPGVIEYIDMEEQPFLMIAENLQKVESMRKLMIDSIKKVKDIKSNTVENRYDDMTYAKYTHCEFHPSFLLGEIPTNIPFCNHNAGPRNIFQYAQGRQAMGIYISNYRDRLDISYILYHPQKPLLATRTAKYLYTDVLPSGENAIVATMCYTGYNQEDSLVFNLSALDRGLFRSTNLKKHVAVIQKNQSTSQDDIFMKPDPSKVAGMRHGSYDKLIDKGYVPEETKIENGDIIIGKVSPIQQVGTSGKPFKDNSEVYRSHAPGVIDKVYTDIFNSDGYEMRKIRTRSERKPRTGDKMCCYTPDHDILTSDGWIPIHQISIHHKVASLVNGDTLQYVKPTAIQSYDCDEEIYVVDTNQVNLRVTKNHRMYVGNRNGKNYGIQEAQDIYGKRLKYKKNVEKITAPEHFSPELIEKDGVITHFVLPPAGNKKEELRIPIKEWLLLFGIWMAEGCTSGKSVSIAAHKERVRVTLDEICDALQIKKWYKTKYHSTDTGINRYETCDVRYYAFFDMLSVRAVNKFLPYWVWDLNMEQCRTLIHGMMLGDGHTMENGTRRYDTSSRQLANDFQRLCLHAGYSTNISVKYEAGHESIAFKGTDREMKIKSTTRAYRMTIIETQNNPLINKNIKRDGSGRNDKYEHYKGKVFCCTVPGDGVVYVRREGMPVWCGNSRNGQKGTIGITLKGSDMPFTARGVTPDLCLNPHAIPSRMTIAQLIETLLCKKVAIDGTEADGTPFNQVDVEGIKNALEKLGYQRNGYEYMYNGMTGEKLKVMICIGPTYYQRLKHQVEDKIHSRQRGPRTLLTRQPPEGRSRDGGLRLGEMERDAIIAHGIALFLKEKLMDTSDAYSTFVCDKCGLFAQRYYRRGSLSHATSNDVYFCPACKNYTEISKIMIPYAFKLLIHEMMSMNIAARIKTKKDVYGN